MIPPITPETKVGVLLDAAPALEATLLAISPRFEALRNPVLRRTVARVATLAQAARIAEIPVPHLVNTLRLAVGQPALDGLDGSAATDDAGPRPEWVASAAPVRAFVAEEIMARGGTPLSEVVAALRDLPAASVVTLDAPFRPAPLIDAVGKLGHETYACPVDAGGANEDAGSRPWRVFIRVAAGH